MHLEIYQNEKCTNESVWNKQNNNSNEKSDEDIGSNKYVCKSKIRLIVSTLCS